MLCMWTRAHVKMTHFLSICPCSVTVEPELTTLAASEDQQATSDDDIFVDELVGEEESCGEDEEEDNRGRRGGGVGLDDLSKVQVWRPGGAVCFPLCLFAPISIFPISCSLARASSRSWHCRISLNTCKPVGALRADNSCIA